MSSVNRDESIIIGNESWRCGGLRARMSHFLDSGFMADCTFLLMDGQGKERTRIPAHRALLSHASPVFQAMLSEVWRPEDGWEIKIRDVTAETFRLLLGYVYTGEVPELDMDSALELLSAAHKYLVSDLLDTYVKHITSSLSAENVCQVLTVAATLSLDGLHRIAFQFLVENTSAVLRAVSFPECSAATLRLILEQDSLSLSSELELVQACVRWGQQWGESTDPERVRVALGTCLGGVDLVFLLRLRGLTTEQLARHVVPSGLLTDKEQSALFCYLVTKGDSPMPQGFTYKTRTYRETRPTQKKNPTEQQVGGTGTKELHAACEEGDVQAVQYLLDAGVPVDVRVKADDDTPLIVAAYKGHVEVVRLLLDHGADLELRSCALQGTPISWAAHYDRTEVVKLLIERGSEVNVVNSQGDTPLLRAVTQGNLELVRVLLEGGADPRVTNRKGDTPLLLAALKGSENSDMIQTIKQYL